MKTKDSFHSFHVDINYSFISGKYNLFRLVCYANNLRSLGGEVFLSAAKIYFSNLLAMAAVKGETVIVMKSL